MRSCFITRVISREKMVCSRELSTARVLHFNMPILANTQNPLICKLWLVLRTTVSYIFLQNLVMQEIMSTWRWALVSHIPTKHCVGLNFEGSISNFANYPNRKKHKSEGLNFWFKNNTYYLPKKKTGSKERS